MFLKIYRYNEIKDLEKIKEHIIQENEGFELICDNENIRKKLMNNNLNPKNLDDYFPRYSEIYYKILEKTKISFLKYENACNKIKFNQYPINTGLFRYLISDLLFLEKIKKILGNNKNTVFVFKKNFFKNFIIQKIANEMNFKNNQVVYGIKNGILYEYNFEESFKEEKISKILKYKKSFRVYSKNISGTTNKISFGLKLAKKSIPMILRLSSSKIYEMNPDNAIKSILKNVNNKISNDHSLEFGFFLSSDREDSIRSHYEIFKKFSNAKIPYKIFTIDPITSSFLEKNHFPYCQIFEEAHILANVLQKTDEAKIFEEKIKNIAISENLSLLYSEKMNPEVIDGFYRVIATSMILDQILNKLSLKNAIINNGVMYGSVVVYLSKNLGIPTTCIIPVLIDEDPILSLLFLADKICIYGTQGQKTLQSFGIDNDRISITGNPKYDKNKFLDSNKSKKILKEKYDIDDRKKIIIIAMSMWHKNDEQWISKLIKFCNQNNTEIIIKLHPKYKRNPEEIENEINFIKIECNKDKFLITFDFDLNILLSAADLVISDYSNVGVEAILLKKIVINQNFVKEDLKRSHNYHEIGAALYAEEYEELEKKVYEILYENKHKEVIMNGYEEIVKRYNSKNDGKASERIFEILTKI